MKAFKRENQGGEFQSRGKSQVNFFFQPGRRRFNIFITLSDYCGGYPRGMFLVYLSLGGGSWGVQSCNEGGRKIVRGFWRVIIPGSWLGSSLEYPRATKKGHFSFESFGLMIGIFLSAFRNISYLCHGLEIFWVQ